MVKRAKTSALTDGSPSCFHRVLLNSSLLAVVTSFQRGWHFSVLPHFSACSSLALIKSDNGRKVKVVVSDRETWTQDDLRVQYVVRPTDRLFVFHVAIANGAAAVVKRMVACDGALATVAALDCAARFGRLALVKFFHGAIQGQGRVSRCAVGLAAKHGHVDVVTFLLRHQYPTYGHHFVLHLLVHGHADFAHFLTDETWYGDALTAAVESGQTRVVEALWPRLHQGATVDALKTAAYHGHTDILRFLLTSAPWLNHADVAHHAAMGGHVAILQLLYEENPECMHADHVTIAIKQWHVDAVAYLVPLVGYVSTAVDSIGWPEHSSKWVAQKPPAGAFLALVKLLLDHGAPSSTLVMDNAALHGALDVVQYLHGRQPHVGCTWEGYMEAAENGHVETLKFLDDNKCVRPSNVCTNTFDEAASRGHLAVVKYFHSTSQGACTTNAMDVAAIDGHLDVVKFLHTHRSEGCTAAAMNGAARNNHLDVVQFLHENRMEGCTTLAMDSAARNGHFDMVKFLHRHRAEGCSKMAMMAAAANGHLDIVKFLHEFRPNDCVVRQTLPFALRYNHVDIVRYFLVECAKDMPESSLGFDPPIRDLLKSLGIPFHQDDVEEGYYLSSDDTIDIDPPVTWLARHYSTYETDDADAYMQ